MNLAASAFGAGLLFGLGLWISGMARPEKVLNFLDLTGTWDASLLFVMGGAVAVTLLAFRFLLKKPLLAEKFELPTRKDIDLPLVAGAVIFGIGWGIGGYCPGPGLTGLATLALDPLVFVAAMLAGGLLHRVVTRA